MADDFTERCRAQIRDEHRSATLYFVSAATTGFDALDDAGQWRTVPELGTAWIPTDSEWVPFRQGRWNWIPPWGWSWIDDAAWAFAPSHYGRWTVVEEQWAWVPGSIAQAPVYAPALVAFLGTPGFGLSAAGTAGPAVAWFPLAPGEIYWPEDMRSPAYLRGLNAPNVSAALAAVFDSDLAAYSVFRGSYANRQFATVVPRQVFSSSADVAGTLLTVPTGRLLQAPVSMSSGIAPGMRTRFSGATVATAKPRDPVPVPARQAATHEPKTLPAFRSATPRRLHAGSPSSASDHPQSGHVSHRRAAPGAAIGQSRPDPLCKGQNSQRSSVRLPSPAMVSAPHRRAIHRLH